MCNVYVVCIHKVFEINISGTWFTYWFVWILSSVLTRVSRWKRVKEPFSIDCRLVYAADGSLIDFKDFRDRTDRCSIVDPISPRVDARNEAPVFVPRWKLLDSMSLCFLNVKLKILSVIEKEKRKLGFEFNLLWSAWHVPHLLIATKVFAILQCLWQFVVQSLRQEEAQHSADHSKCTENQQRQIGRDVTEIYNKRCYDAGHIAHDVDESNTLRSNNCRQNLSRVLHSNVVRNVDTESSHNCHQCWVQT